MVRTTARRRAGPLETVFVEIPEHALEAYEAAFDSACDTIGFFLADEDARIWRVEGVRDADGDDAPLHQALLLAASISGAEAELHREPTEAEGWLARTEASFPPSRVGQRFLVRGTHDAGPEPAGLVTLTLDAGLAFGSGEHGSTRGCLRAFEGAARRMGRRPASDRPGPWRLIDVGTGSGILAMAAAKLLRRPVLATDIEPWSVRVAGQNARDNGVGRLVRPVLADGWRTPAVRAGAPYDLVFANILARPLCRMAHDLARHLAPGGHVILAGLLRSQVRMVLAAHRRQGLRLERVLTEGQWATLVLRKLG
jgi:ribosomal protein L11 methyltransferase